MEPMRVLVSELSPDTAPGTVFDRYADAGVLAHQVCEACGTAFFPPRVLCPSCGAGELEWRPSSGRGVVYSATTIAPRGGAPYTVALVDLDEGYRMMSTVSDPDGGEVAIGDAVTVRFEPRDDASALPVFDKAAQR